jgi:hypothetical protein
MIDKITLDTFIKEQGDIIFPKVHIQKAEDGFIVSTFVNVNGYLLSFKKKVPFLESIDYVDFSKFIDSIMVDINRLRINFNSTDVKNWKHFGIYKLIE